ncbi:hypothetical protein D0437_33045, partial [Bacillus cereus]
MLKYTRNTYRQMERSQMTNAHQNEKENLLVAMKTIYFYVQGYSIKEIMNMIGRSEKTI